MKEQVTFFQKEVTKCPDNAPWLTAAEHRAKSSFLSAANHFLWADCSLVPLAYKPAFGFTSFLQIYSENYCCFFNNHVVSNNKVKDIDKMISFGVETKQKKDDISIIERGWCRGGINMF